MFFYLIKKSVDFHPADEIEALGWFGQTWLT